MAALPTDFRNKLERTVIEARDVAEAGARAALEALAVHHNEPYSHQTPEQRKLRNHLRAHARQLGDRQDSSGRLQIGHLVHECAYEHWHRMLFARFLVENDLLIEPSAGVAISLQECEELAKEAKTDLWAYASRCAQKMLPQIFRPDDPVLQVHLSPEDRIRLERLLGSLDPSIFRADDSLGWVYQFWQSKRKKQVNDSGVKIGADELPAVTQLFTEHYMVLFLLHNTLGAWWTGKRLNDGSIKKQVKNAQNEDEVRRILALPGYSFDYLRLIKEEKEDITWRPAAGTFRDWPKAAKNLKVLDPCCGSGHFVVALLILMTRIRMFEEGISAKDALDLVLRDNLFGLEIDSRCTQIAVFSVALASWKFEAIGYRPLPNLNIACSGLPIGAKREEWVDLAGNDIRLKAGMERLYQIFGKAPVLGSLINPQALGGDLLVAEFHDLQPLLDQALANETPEDMNHELALTARGLTKAAEILGGGFNLVVTNVPYLGRGKQDDLLKDYCERAYSSAKADLATCFVERCLDFCASGGTTGLVIPQNWLFLGTYTQLRIKLLRQTALNLIGRLGPGAFETPLWDFNVMLLVVSNRTPTDDHTYSGTDAASLKTPLEKAAALVSSNLRQVRQAGQLDNPDSRIGLEEPRRGPLLAEAALIPQGVKTGDDNHFRFLFWEISDIESRWRFYQSTPDGKSSYSGMTYILRWDNEGAELARLQGESAWGRLGIAVSQMAAMPMAYYLGSVQDSNINVVIPKNPAHLLAIVSFVESPEFKSEVRRLDQKLSVTNATFGKVPFDLAHWQQVAIAKYPNGLSNPLSKDPRQWLFVGDPRGSEQPFQVAIARLLGYRWPRQAGASFPDCPAIGPDDLETYAEADGIICIPSVRGDEPAADRLGAIIAACGMKLERDLDDWLRNNFFEEHCKLFHHRPFIWHIWDGRRRDGFHALVNYHKLAEGSGKGQKLLENLTYSYLGEWVTRQQDGIKRGEEGAEDRLAAALELQKRLIAILEGEPPFDIFVRWKPFHEQPIGWEPDINDGVRLNIRPFMASGLPNGRTGAGILRWKPNIKWEKDRGKEPHHPKSDFPWFWGWDGKVDFMGGKEFTGERFNGCHYTIAAKQQARDSHKK